MRGTNVRRSNPTSGHQHNGQIPLRLSDQETTASTAWSDVSFDIFENQEHQSSSHRPTLRLHGLQRHLRTYFGE